jgi:hypothetical protein
MIDLEARARRLAWLKFLQPGDTVRFLSALGKGTATVESIEANRIWVNFEIQGGGRVRSWVWRDSGDCPGARICIEPADPAVGGGEAA